MNGTNGSGDGHTIDDDPRETVRHIVNATRWFARANYSQFGEMYGQLGAVVRELSGLTLVLSSLAQQQHTQRSPSQRPPSLALPPMRSRTESTIALEELRAISAPTADDTVQSRALRSEIDAKIAPLLDEKRLRQMQKEEANDRLAYYAKLLGLGTAAITFLGVAGGAVLYLARHWLVPALLRP